LADLRTYRERSSTPLEPDVPPEDGAMNEAAIRTKLEELFRSVAATGQESDDRTEGIYRHDGNGEEPVLEAMDRLRLQVKYLMFDLEATRRENRYLRMMLESRHRRGKNRNNEDPDTDAF
jgi:hypothetical protein